MALSLALSSASAGPLSSSPYLFFCFSRAAHSSMYAYCILYIDMYGYSSSSIDIVAVVVWLEEYVLCLGDVKGDSETR